MFRYSYAGTRVIQMQMEKEDRRISMVMRTSIGTVTQVSIKFISFFLSLFWKTQANHRIERMVSTRLTTQDPRNCSRPEEKGPPSILSRPCRSPNVQKKEKENKSIQVGLGISRTNADSEWNSVTTLFIEIFVVETKGFVGSFVNMILTRQTCGQRSSGAAESKRRALGI